MLCILLYFIEFMKCGDLCIIKIVNYIEIIGIRYGSGKFGFCSDVYFFCKLLFSICFYGVRFFFVLSLCEENGMFDIDCVLLLVIRWEIL